MEVNKWQELEEITFKALESHGFECMLRKVFKDSSRRYEIDVIAMEENLTLAFDCKYYLRTKSRTSALRREARKHFRRCERYRELTGERVIPILLTFLDDSLFCMEGCVVVPLRALNDFLLRRHFYLELFSKANLSVDVSMGSVP